MMPTATISIGIPASGKTTFLKRKVADTGAVYVCPDDIRLNLTGNASTQNRNREVWALAYQQISSALASGRDVVVDATCAKRLNRLQLVAHCRQAGAGRIIGIWFTTPLKLCLKRNQARDRKIPEISIGIMTGWLQAQPPSRKEGFDQLIKIDTSR